jgi:hypothetical protein
MTVVSMCVLLVEKDAAADRPDVSNEPFTPLSSQAAAGPGKRQIPRSQPKHPGGRKTQSQPPGALDARAGQLRRLPLGNHQEDPASRLRKGAGAEVS